MGAIHAAAYTMLEIIDEIQEFTKLGGAEKPACIPFNPGRVLTEVSYLFQTLIVRPNVSFTTEIEEGMPETLVGDPSALSQVLMNLIGNAVKFVEHGRIVLRVRSESQGDRCALLGQVEDTGPGIPREEIGQIFNAFHQGSQFREAHSKGSGLGLSIVKKLIERDGGRIWVESVPGKGSCFNFRIPYAFGARNDSRERRDEPAALSRLDGFHILVFEDNPLNLKLAETRLKSWGCTVFGAERAQSGLQLLQEVPVNLVLMDLHLDGTDGFTVSRQIRNHPNPAVRNLPIIAITADITAGLDGKLTASGIDGVLLKPFTPGELLGKLREFLPAEVQKGATLNADARQSGNIAALDELWEDCSGNIGMLEDLLQLLKNNLLEFLGNLRIHIPVADYSSIEAASHKVKAGLKMIQAAKWLEQVESIHKLSRTRSGIDRIESQYQCMVREYDSLEKKLESDLDKIRKDHEGS